MSIVKVYFDLIKLALIVTLEVSLTIIEVPVSEVPVHPENSYPLSGVAVTKTEVF